MTLDAAFESFWNQVLPMCNTTMTPRLPRTNCECDTYPTNLGPCIQMGELGTEGKCPYCDHLPKCHLREVFRLGWQAAPSSSQPVDWRQFHVGCCNGNHSKPLGGPMCVCHPHKLNEIITQQQIRIRELEAESSPKPTESEICPSCQAIDNKPYVDAKGIQMRACGRCMIQWRATPSLHEALVAAVPWLFEYGRHQDPECTRTTLAGDVRCHCGLDEARNIVETALVEGK